MLLDKQIALDFISDPTLAIPLECFSEISEEAAELLAESHLRALDLGGLTELTQPAAAHLGSFKGNLYLDGIEDLSPEILEEFSERSWKTTQYLGLNGLRTVEEVQARALSSFHGRLGLAGITSISEKCTEILGSGSASYLYFDGVENITEASLIHLIGHGNRSFLGLNGLRTIDEGQARALSSFYGGLSLAGITSISEKCAKILGTGKAVTLYFDGLENITEASLINLIDHGNRSANRSLLSLNGLEALPEIKRDLSDMWDLENPVEEIFLRGLRFTTYDSLKKVAAVVNVLLYLDSLEYLPQQEGPLEYSAGMILNGLKRITKVDAQNLSYILHLELNNLEEIDVECARLLAATTRDFGFISIGLRKMSDEVAAELVRSECEHFQMDRLEELTPFAAEVCGRDVYAPYVSFDGLQQISEEAFELLLADYSGQKDVWHPGSISLNGLKHLTPRMRNALEKTVHDVSLNGIKDGL